MAARPHGPDAASGEWSIGPQEPYWRTNTSYSPPPSRWDFRFQPESLSFGSNEESQLYGSSTSSNSRESRSWSRANHFALQHYPVSDGAGAYFSSPSEISPVQQWTPPVIQEINVGDYGNSSRRGMSHQLSISCGIFKLSSILNINVSLNFATLFVNTLFEGCAAWSLAFELIIYTSFFCAW